MTEIKIVIDKRGRKQYHEYRNFPMRSFRISESEAQFKVTTGQAVFVDKFWFERKEQQDNKRANQDDHQSKVVNLFEHKKEKERKEITNQAIDYFASNILPKMSMDEMQKLMSITDREVWKEEMTRILFRIQIESLRNQ
jgi:hypothetical protein